MTFPCPSDSPNKSDSPSSASDAGENTTDFGASPAAPRPSSGSPPSPLRPATARPPSSTATIDALRRRKGRDCFHSGPPPVVPLQMAPSTLRDPTREQIQPELDAEIHRDLIDGDERARPLLEPW